jgi:hypothetical protein
MGAPLGNCNACKYGRKKYTKPSVIRRDKYAGLMQTSTAPYLKAARRRVKPRISVYEQMHRDAIRKAGKYLRPYEG